MCERAIVHTAKAVCTAGRHVCSRLPSHCSHPIRRSGRDAHSGTRPWRLRLWWAEPGNEGRYASCVQGGVAPQTQHAGDGAHAVMYEICSEFRCKPGVGSCEST
eukprot:4716344-Prymnesium_polylepis.2